MQAIRMPPVYRPFRGSNDRLRRIAESFGGYLPTCPPCGRFVEECACTCPFCGERDGCTCCIGTAIATGGG